MPLYSPGPGPMVLPRFERILTGIHGGMLGGIAMTAAMMFFSVMDRRGWWTYPNLLGSSFYGARALSSGPGWTTVSGVALQLIVAAAAGCAFALLFGPVRGMLRVFSGLIWGLLLFFVCEQVYRGITPLIAVHIQRGPALSAHLIYGVVLASSVRRGALTGNGLDLRMREAATSRAADQARVNREDIKTPAAVNGRAEHTTER